jgi:hypothetical protein
MYNSVFVITDRILVLALFILVADYWRLARQVALILILFFPHGLPLLLVDLPAVMIYYYPFVITTYVDR